MTTKDIVLGYFRSLQDNGHWEEHLSESMTFTSFVNPIKRAAGRAVFLEATRRFYSMIKNVEVKKLVVEDLSACALTRYELQPPTGPAFECHVAEVFEVQDGKVSALDIYFDSSPFPK